VAGGSSIGATTGGGGDIKGVTAGHGQSVADGGITTGGGLTGVTVGITGGITGGIRAVG